MKFLKYYILILTVFALSIAQGQTETIMYDVIHSGKPLGTLEAIKTVDGDKVTYFSHTYIEYHLFATIKIDYKYNVIYENDVLSDATVKIMVRGHEKTDVETKRNGDGYDFYDDEDKEDRIDQLIYHSIERLMFEEPIGVTQVYAEEHGEFHDLKKIGDYTYLKTAPNGHKNTYFYENGKLVKSEVDAGVIEFSIVLKK